MTSLKFVAPLRFGVFELDARTGELRKQGLKVRLSSQTAKLLLFLLEAPGEVRSKEELQQSLWPGSKFMDLDNSLAKVVHVLRETLGDLASNPRFIETVPGQGYRFIPVLQQLSATPSKSRTSRKIESVAVLPFATEGGEPDLAFIGRQITSRVTNALAKVAGLSVLAQSTVKHNKLQQANPKLIGEDLHVDAVVAGELSRHNPDLFLNVELIDTANGRQLWGVHLRQNGESLVESSELLVREVLQQLQPILTSKQDRIAPISSRPHSLRLRKVSGNRS
ncbi:MAG: winged helix-turn-helix domain-containing protein [Terriglobales bacterium]